MDYKEKYEQALEKAKEIIKDYESRNLNDISIYAKEDLTVIFPELRENEDEKNKRILHSISSKMSFHLCDIFTEEEFQCFDTWSNAWLEKQGTPAMLSEEEQNRFAKGVLTSCAMSFIDYIDAHKYEGKMCVSNGECEDIENAFHNAMWDRLHRYYCKYIEKQGEQKSTDKVEHKFKVGDKIEYIGDRKELTAVDYVIQEVRSDSYYCKNGSLIPFKFQNEFRLVGEQKPAEWSEEDKKHINSLLDRLKGLCKNEFVRTTFAIDEDEEWLKSLEVKVANDGLERVLEECRSMEAQSIKHRDNPVDRTDEIEARASIEAFEYVIRFIKKLKD